MDYYFIKAERVISIYVLVSIASLLAIDVVDYDSNLTYAQRKNNKAVKEKFRNYSDQ